MPKTVLSTAGVAACAMSALMATAGFAADRPGDDRSTPGTVVPGTGTTAGTAAPGQAVPPPRAEPRDPRATAGSLSGTQGVDCAALRERYAQSQACFAPYRLTNGGLKPQAFEHCKEIRNPSAKCGPAVVE